MNSPSQSPLTDYCQKDGKYLVCLNEETGPGLPMQNRILKSVVLQLTAKREMSQFIHGGEQVGTQFFVGEWGTRNFLWAKGAHSFL